MNHDKERLTLVLPEGIQAGVFRAFYAAMLAELPWERVRKFWQAHPFAFHKRPVKSPDVFRLVWDGKLDIPADYFWPFIGDMAAFLKREGWDPERFFRLVNMGLQGGPPVSPRWVLDTLASAGDKRRRSEGPRAPAANAPGPAIADPREWLLMGLDVFLRRLFPGCRAQRLHAGRQGRYRFAVLLFHPLPSLPLRAWDFRLFPGLFLEALPLLFAWTGFERMEMLADMRSADSAGGEGGGLAWKGDRLCRGGRTLGHLDRLGAVLEPWDDGALRDEYARPVMLMDKDLPGPDKNRPLLRKGCAYGAPFSVLRIGYSESRRWERFSLPLLRRRSLASVETPPPSEAMLEVLHREFLSSWEDFTTLSSS